MVPQFNGAIKLKGLERYVTSTYWKERMYVTIEVSDSSVLQMIVKKHHKIIW